MTQVAIFIGSASDDPIVGGCAEVLKKLGISFRYTVTSAHRTPERTAQLMDELEADGVQVYICAAGMAAHLAGAFAGNSTLPVIGIPMKGGAMDGLDALLATVQMPSGIPVATVAIGGAVNAALLAMEMLAISDEDLAKKLADKRAADTAAVLAKKLADKRAADTAAVLAKNAAVEAEFNK